LGFQQRWWSVAERAHHPSGRERMGTPTPKALTEPILTTLQAAAVRPEPRPASQRRRGGKLLALLSSPQAAPGRGAFPRLQQRGEAPAEAARVARGHASHHTPPGPGKRRGARDTTEWGPSQSQSQSQSPPPPEPESAPAELCMHALGDAGTLQVRSELFRIVLNCPDLFRLFRIVSNSYSRGGARAAGDAAGRVHTSAAHAHAHASVQKRTNFGWKRRWLCEPAARQAAAAAAARSLRGACSRDQCLA
jgi:hypothetical protein